MIWIWIMAAVAISWLLCRKKAVWYHYIWMLLPIEMYGITVAGATIKPYMLFGCLIILCNIQRRRAYKIPVAIFCVVFSLIVSDILNGLIIASVMQHIMFILIIYIAYCYVNLLNEDVDWLKSIENVTIATTIGYGLTFILAYIAYTIQPQIGGVYCTDRYSVGMFLRFVSTGGVATVRLRGFCVDPNSVVTTLIPGAAFALENLVYGKHKKIYHLIAMMCYGSVVVLSGSRMALICTLAMVIAVILPGFRQAENKGKWIISFVLFATVLLVVGAYYYQEIMAEIYSFFTARAGLNDEAGRLTIWRKNIEWLSENGRLLIGVGQNQIANLTTAGKACHNTWLEWICGTGLLIGGGIVIWFFSAPIKFGRYAKQLELKPSQYLPLLFAYITTAVCITTVDNITNSVLIFLMAIFNYGCLNRIEESQKLSR